MHELVRIKLNLCLCRTRAMWSPGSFKYTPIYVCPFSHLTTHSLHYYSCYNYRLSSSFEYMPKLLILLPGSIQQKLHLTGFIFPFASDHKKVCSSKHFSIITFVDVNIFLQTRCHLSCFHLNTFYIGIRIIVSLPLGHTRLRNLIAQNFRQH